MPEPTWTPYRRDTFSRADSSVGSGTDSSTGVPGTPDLGTADNYRDHEGNKFRIQSGKLQRVSTSNSWQGTLLWCNGTELYADVKCAVSGDSTVRVKLVPNIS